MAKISLDIEKMITVDETGMPQAPNIRQLQDADLLTIFSRDKTQGKLRYLKECGVIYYLGDPKSPARQQGLTDDEALKLAIDNYDLPKDYFPDEVVKRLIEKYYISNITEAGVALETLQKSVHLISVGANRINEFLTKKLSSNTLSDEDMQQVLSMCDMVSKRVAEIPALNKALATAYENLRNESEQTFARGGKLILSSMDADEETL